MTDGHLTNSFAPKHDHDLCVSDAIRKAEKYCFDNGLRWTPLRAQVFELVWAHHRPARAYDILENLSKVRSESAGAEGRHRVAPPTVYRALDFLLQHGFVHRIDSLNAFVGCGKIGHAERTCFLICRECGEAAELQDAGLSAALASCAQQADFAVERETVEITGLCPKCRPL